MDWWIAIYLIAAFYSKHNRIPSIWKMDEIQNLCKLLHIQLHFDVQLHKTLFPLIVFGLVHVLVIWWGFFKWYAWTLQMTRHIPRWSPFDISYTVGSNFVGFETLMDPILLFFFQLDRDNVVCSSIIEDWDEMRPICLMTVGSRKIRSRNHWFVKKALKYIVRCVKGADKPGRNVRLSHCKTFIRKWSVISDSKQLILEEMK